MEKLIVLAVIWFVVNAIRKSNKGKGSAQKKSGLQAHAVNPKNPAPLTAAQPTIEPTIAPSVAPTIAPRLVVPFAAQEPCDDFTDSHEHAEGESHVDASGCVGGTLSHLHEESFVPEGPGMLAAMRAEPDAKLAMPKPKPPKTPFVPSRPISKPAAKKTDELTAASVRRAFIMAEIIGKPVSVRKSARV